MRKYLLLFAIFVSLLYFSHDASATYGAGVCVDSCNNCNATIWGLAAECTNVRCLTLSCINGRSSCEREFKTDGIACQTGGKICTSGMCACPADKPLWDGIKCYAPPVCIATLSPSSSGCGTCSQTASISSTTCSGLGYEVKDSGSVVKCSGTLSGSDACPSSWSTATGMQNYNLYVAGKLNDTKSADCPSCSCDSTSYTTCASALALTSGSLKTAVCGEQFYKITVTGSGVCDLTWTLTPDSNADYDLYTKWTTDACPGTASKDCESANGIGSVDTCARTAITSGTYYAFVKKTWVETSSAAYKIKATLSNCRTLGRNLAVDSITVPSVVPTNSIVSMTVVVSNPGQTTERVVFTVS